MIIVGTEMCPGVKVVQSGRGSWRCSKCRELQHGELPNQCMISDSVKVGDSLESIEGSQQLSNKYLGWCLVSVEELIEKARVE